MRQAAATSSRLRVLTMEIAPPGATKLPSTVIWPLLVRSMRRPGSTLTTAPSPITMPPLTSGFATAPATGLGMPPVSDRSAPARCLSVPLSAFSVNSGGR